MCVSACYIYICRRRKGGGGPHGVAAIAAECEVVRTLAASAMYIPARLDKRREHTQYVLATQHLPGIATHCTAILPFSTFSAGRGRGTHGSWDPCIRRAAGAQIAAKPTSRKKVGCRSSSRRQARGRDAPGACRRPGRRGGVQGVGGGGSLLVRGEERRGRWRYGAWVRQGIGPQLVFRQGCGALTETAVAGVSAELLGGRYVFWRAQCLKGY